MRYLSLIILASSLASGCAIWPDRKEFLQREVPVYPEQSFKELEALRQAASRAKESAVETLMAARAEEASASVVAPAEDVVILADAVSTSVGPPLTQPVPTTPAELIAAKVLKETALHNRDLDKLRAKLAPLEGKDVEGTGRIQVGYFTMLGGIAIVALLAWSFLRAIVAVAAQANPGVALGASAAGSVLKIGGSVLSRGFKQVLIGGEKFKQALEEKLEPAVAEQVKALFRETHQRAQDEEVQVAVKAATGAMKDK